MSKPTLDDMIAAKRAGERRTRQRFDAKWGAFAKCSRCGASARLRRNEWPPVPVACARRDCNGAMRVAGYSPPPMEAR